MKGGNLIHAKSRFLFNTLATKDFGAYLNSDDGKQHLVIKEHGLDLPGSVDPVIAHPEGWYGKKTVSNPGVRQVVQVELHPDYPCDDCNFDAWIMVHNKAKHDGFTNEYISVGRTYNSVTGQLNPAVGGKVDPAQGGDLDRIKVDIVNAVNNDPGAIVIAGVGQKFTVVDDAVDSGFTMDGNVFVGTGVDGASKAIDLAANINLMFPPFAAAAVGLDVYFTMLENPSVVPFTPVNGTLEPNTYHAIMLVAKDPRQKFDVSYETESFATQILVEAGEYPILDFEAMMREWSVKEWHAGGYVNVPIDAPYVKYYIRVVFENHPGLVGASSVERRYREVEIYVKEDLIDDLIWDSVLGFMAESSVPGFVADSSLEDILEAVFFDAPDNW